MNLKPVTRLFGKVATAAEMAVSVTKTLEQLNAHAADMNNKAEKKLDMIDDLYIRRAKEIAEGARSERIAAGIAKVLKEELGEELSDGKGTVSTAAP